MEDKTYHCFEYEEFGEFVEQALGIEYECVAANEWNNYSSYSSDNVLRADYEKDFFEKYDLPDIQKAIQNKNLDSVEFHSILVYLVYHGFLPEGNYLISVFL